MAALWNLAVCLTVFYVFAKIAGWIDRTADLVVAMLSGKMRQVLEQLPRWASKPEEKADAIQRLLLSVFLTKVLKMRSNDSMMATLSPEHADAISSKMAELAPARALNLADFWRAAIRLWDPAPAIREASLIAQAERFTTLMADNV